MGFGRKILWKRVFQENDEWIRLFIKPYCIINTTDLFSDEACDKISKKYNTFGVIDSSIMTKK